MPHSRAWWHDIQHGILTLGFQVYFHEQSDIPPLCWFICNFVICNMENGQQACMHGQEFTAYLVGLSCYFMHKCVLWPDDSVRLRMNVSYKVRSVFTDWCHTDNFAKTRRLFGYFTKTYLTYLTVLLLITSILANFFRQTCFVFSCTSLFPANGD